MENEIFTSLVDAISRYLGIASTLASGNGVRFKSPAKGKATIYHNGIASGNHAEIAFEVQSMASRFGVSEAEFRSFVAALQASTGRPVQPNSQYNWPRIGLDSKIHIALIVDAVQNQLPAASS